MLSYILICLCVILDKLINTLLIIDHSTIRYPLDCYQTEMENSIDNISKTIEIQNFKYRCPKCGQLYKRKETIFRHIKQECGVKRLFKCDICLQQFKRHEYFSHKCFQNIGMEHI